MAAVRASLIIESDPSPEAAGRPPRARKRFPRRLPRQRVSRRRSLRRSSALEGSRDVAVARPSGTRRAVLLFLHHVRVRESLLTFLGRAAFAFLGNRSARDDPKAAAGSSALDGTLCRRFFRRGCDTLTVSDGTNPVRRDPSGNVRVLHKKLASDLRRGKLPSRDCGTHQPHRCAALTVTERHEFIDGHGPAERRAQTGR